MEMTVRGSVTKLINCVRVTVDGRMLQLRLRSRFLY